MKIRSILASLLAVAAIAVSCSKEEDSPLGAPSVAFDQETLYFEQAGGSKTLTFTASRDWTVSTEDTWIGLSTTSGSASTKTQTITVTADANSSYDRGGVLTFTLGKGLVEKSILVIQAGTGEAPIEGVFYSYSLKSIGQGDYTIEDVNLPSELDYIWTYKSSYGMVAAGSKKVDDKYVNYDGESWLISENIEIPSSISTAYLTFTHAANYFTNIEEEATLWVRVVNEDGSYGEWTQFTIPNYPTGWTFVSSGDIDLSEYIGKTIQLGFCYKGNSSKAGTWEVDNIQLSTDESSVTPVDPDDAPDETTGTADDPYTVAKALYIINNNLMTDQNVYVKGVVTSIKEISTSYGNGSYYIKDADGTDEFYIFRGYYLGNTKFTSEDQLKANDEVVVYGKLILYSSTPEMAQGNYITELNGEKSGGESTGDHTDDGTTGTVDDPYTVNQALYLTENGLNDEEAYVYVKGTVSSIKEISTSYGNGTYYISDDGSTTDQYYIFRGYYLGGEKFTSEDQIKVGDEVVIYGKLITYNSTYEMAQGNYIYSLNGETSGSGEETGDHTDDGTTGTVSDPYTVNKVLYLMENNQNDESAQVYVKGKISQIKEVSTSYGNATYYISDDGSTTDQYYIFRGYYLGNVKFTSEDQIKVGDEVVIYGKLITYNSTYEMAQGNYIYSLNGSTSETGSETGGEETGDHTDDGTTGTVSDPYTVNKVLYLMENSQNDESAQVYVKGKISQIKEVSTSYGNATYYISDDGSTSDQYYIFRGYYLGNVKFTSSSQIKVGDEVVIYGKLITYNSTYEMAQGNYIYSLNGSTTASDSGETTGDSSEYASTASYTAGTNAYTDLTATVNGVSGVATLKLGTSKKAGDATITLPSGTSAMTFYAVSWKNKAATLVITVDGTDYTFSPAANDGAAGNENYTLTVSDSDKYTLTLPSTLTADTEATVTTSGSNTRVILFGIQTQ